VTIIIIEGCDGTGKSTLAAKCAEVARTGPYHTVRELHYSVPSYDPDSDLTIGQQAMNQLLEPLQDYDALEDFVIIDRFHWGEPVYAPVFRPDRCVDALFGTLTYADFYYVEDWLQSCGALTAFCTAPEKVILQRVQDERPDTPDLIADSDDPAEKTRQVRKRYDTLYRYVTDQHRKSPSSVRPLTLLEPSDTESAAMLLCATAAIDAANVASYAMNHVTPSEYVETRRPVLMNRSDS
jgi:thymidylate kinase